MFSSLPETEIIILATLNLSSANAFNLVKAKILSFDKQLTLFSLRVCKTKHFKPMWEEEKLLITSNSPHPTVFSTLWENFLPFSSNLELRSANSFSLEKFKIVVWERVEFSLHEFDLNSFFCL